MRPNVLHTTPPWPCFEQDRLLQLLVAAEVEEEAEDEAVGCDFEEDLIHAPDDCEACYGGGVTTAPWLDVDTLQVDSTPLFMAAYYGHSAILLEARAHIHQRDVFGYDPLSAAAEEGMLEVVKILCRNRANVNSRNQYSLSPLQLATSNAHTKTVEELCRYSADVNYVASEPMGSFKLRTALHMAAAGQCADIVRLLCQAAAKLDAFTDDGLSAVAVAAVHGNPKVVQALCLARADGRLRSPSSRPGGENALDLARQHGHTEVVKILGGSWSNRSLPLKSDFFDLIVVDPPWGQRHSSHAYVKHHLYAWAREWARLLKPGGTLWQIHAV
eukprot:s691_g3.t1